MLVLPGTIDAHTHFDLSLMNTTTADDFTTGSRACAAGGVTTFIDFATQKRGESLFDAVKARRSEADGKVCVDYSLHASPTDFCDDTFSSIPGLIEMGIPSFKLYMAYAREGMMADDGALVAMLEKVRDFGGLVTVHAENAVLPDWRSDGLLKAGRRDVTFHAPSRPHFVEVEAIRRILFFTEITGSRLYIVHVTTGEGVRLIGEAKGKGMAVFGETCPQYLLLTDDAYNGPEGHHFVGTPPLRKSMDNEMLWRGLSVGAIQVVATDHCSFRRDQKDPCRDNFTTIPRGLPGVETLLPLMYSEGVRKGRLSASQLVEILSTNPAKLFGLYPRKGSLIPGADADLVIFDGSKTKTVHANELHMNTDFSPYEGMEVTGWPKITISKGKVICRDGEVTAKEGRGEFIPRFYGEGDWEKFSKA
jgi:dihydropyrimidinase